MRIKFETDQMIEGELFLAGSTYPPEGTGQDDRTDGICRTQIAYAYASDLDKEEEPTPLVEEPKAVLAGPSAPEAPTAEADSAETL